VPQVQFIYFLFLVRRKILSILDSIDFSQEIPEPLQLDFFDRAQIEQVIANCEHKNLQGQTVCNVKVRAALTSLQ
jgi:nuclear pore complex protein Nup205